MAKTWAKMSPSTLIVESTDIAPEYSASKTYEADEPCFKDGNLVRCVTPGTGPEAVFGPTTDVMGIIDDEVDAVRDELKSAAVKKPFGIYAVDGATPAAWRVYVPEGSLFVNGREVPVAGSVNGYVALAGAGDVYCTISAVAPEDDDSSDAPASNVDPDPLLVQDGAVLTASIVSTLPADDLFHFKVGSVSSADGSIAQSVYGAAFLTVPFAKERIPFHVYDFHMTYGGQDYTFYGMYTPSNGTLKVNGSYYPIAEAEGAWTWLDIDICVAGVYKFFCWSKNGVAHIGRDLPSDISPKDICFPAATVVVGDGAGDDGDGTGSSPSTGGVYAVVSGVGDSKMERRRAGGEVDVQHWSNWLGGHGAQVVSLVNETSTVNATLEAFEDACSHPGGLAVLFVAGHGTCQNGSNHITLYDGNLTDSAVWNIVKNAKGKVWLIFDSCMSGSMYGPPTAAPLSAEAPARSFAESVRLLAESDPSSVTMLCWSAADDSNYGWGTEEYGGEFTCACMRHLTVAKTYSEVWQTIVSDAELLAFQTPQATTFGSVWSTDKVLAALPAEDASSGGSDDSSDDSDAPVVSPTPLPVVVKQRASGLMYIKESPTGSSSFGVTTVEKKELTVNNYFADTYESAFYLYAPGGSVWYDGEQVDIYGMDGNIVQYYTEVSVGEIWMYLEKDDTTGEVTSHVSLQEDVPDGCLDSFPIATVGQDGTVQNYVYGTKVITPPKVSGMTLSATGVFAPVYDTGGADPEVVTGFTNCFYQVGGYTCDMGNQSTVPGTDGFICVSIDASSGSRNATLACFGTLQSLQEAQGNIYTVVVPLYLMQSSKIIADLRNIPTAQMVEVL